MKTLIITVDLDDKTDADKLLDDIASTLEDFRDRERPSFLTWKGLLASSLREAAGYEGDDERCYSTSCSHTGTAHLVGECHDHEEEAE